MLELLIRLERVRQGLRRRVLGEFGENNYYVVAGVFALAFAGGTVLTGFIGIPTTGALGVVAVVLHLGLP
jgi:hypothetical protein